MHLGGRRKGEGQSPTAVANYLEGGWVPMLLVSQLRDGKAHPRGVRALLRTPEGKQPAGG